MWGSQPAEGIAACQGSGATCLSLAGRVAVGQAAVQCPVHLGTWALCPKALGSRGCFLVGQAMCLVSEALFGLAGQGLALPAVVLLPALGHGIGPLWCPSLLPAQLFCPLGCGHSSCPGELLCGCWGRCSGPEQCQSHLSADGLYHVHLPPSTLSAGQRAAVLSIARPPGCTLQGRWRRAAFQSPGEGCGVELPEMHLPHCPSCARLALPKPWLSAYWLGPCGAAGNSCLFSLPSPPCVCAR